MCITVGKRDEDKTVKFPRIGARIVAVGGAEKNELRQKRRK